MTKFDELVTNMELLHSTGEKVRAEECVRLAKELLLKDGEINVEVCREMIKTTPLRLAWAKREEDENREYLGLRYKDIGVEFYSMEKIHFGTRAIANYLGSK